MNSDRQPVVLHLAGGAQFTVLTKLYESQLFGPWRESSGTYAVPHVPILKVVTSRMLPTSLVPVDVATTGESECIPDPKVAHCRYDLGTLDFDDKRAGVSQIAAKTYCSGSIYTSA